MRNLISNFETAKLSTFLLTKIIIVEKKSHLLQNSVFRSEVVVCWYLIIIFIYLTRFYICEYDVRY